MATASSTPHTTPHPTPNPQPHPLLLQTATASSTPHTAPHPTPYPPIPPPALADGNGKLDLLVSTMNGNLYCIATQAKYHPLLAWPQQVGVSVCVGVFGGWGCGAGRGGGVCVHSQAGGVGWPG